MLSPKDAAINTGGELRRAGQQPPPGPVRACRYRADRRIREIVNDDQKRKLDQLDQEPHLSGTATQTGRHHRGRGRPRIWRDPRHLSFRRV